MQMPETVFYNSPVKNIVLLIISLLFIVGGAFLVIVEGPSLMSVGSTVVFGLCAIGFVRQLLDRQPRIIINDAGIYDRRLGIAPVPWDDIKNATLVPLPGNNLVRLELQQPRTYARTATSGIVSRLPATEVSQLLISLSGVKADSNEVIALLLRNLEARRSTVTQPWAL